MKIPSVRGLSRRAIPLALVLSTTLLPPPGLARTGQQPEAERAPAQAEWTLMLYLDADNNLEDAILDNLKQMLSVGSSKDVNLVALVDRSPQSDPDGGYTDEDIVNVKNWSSTKVFYIEKGQLRELGDWHGADVGDPATLEKFAQETVRNFPARRYGLILSDHGAAWPGVCVDDSHNDDMLTNVKLGAALDTITKSTGRLELLGFDACLMANLETAYVAAPYAKTMVASEEVEPGEGWNYTPLLTSLEANPKMDGVEFGRLVADTFNSFFNNSSEPQLRNTGLGITLSVIALDRIEPLARAVNALSDRCGVLSKTRESWLKIAYAHSKAEEYGKSAEGSSSVFDLQEFAQLLHQQAPDPETAAAADAVVRAIADAVVYHIHGKARPGANGISIFLPPNAEKLQEKEWIGYGDISFAKASKWSKFLADYTGTESTDITAPALSQVNSSAPALNEEDTTQHETIAITSSVKADDLDDATFVLAKVEGEEQVILGEVPAAVDSNGKLHEEWDGGWFTIGNGKSEIISPIMDLQEVEGEKDGYFAVVPAQVRQKGRQQWQDVTLYFYLDFAKEDSVSGEFVYAFEETGDGMSEFELNEGDQVRPVYVSYDAKGEPHFVASTDPSSVLPITTADDLVVGYKDVPAGDYLLGFVVTDFSGNTGEDYVAVKVE
jgi:clostripain